MKKITLMIFTVLLSITAYAQVTPVAADSGQCNGTATLTNNGTLASWKWYKQTILLQTNGFVIDSLCAGSYMVVRVDTVNFTDTVAFTIGTSTPNPCGYLTASVSATNAHTGSCDGTLTATSNGTNLSYTWSNNNFAHTANITGVCSGAYTVTITDPNGCVKTASGSVGTDTTSNSCSYLTASVSVTNSHTGTCDGSLNVTSNGTSLTYVWSDTTLQHIAHPTGVCYGAYTVTVTDPNGCVKTASGFVNTDTTTNPCSYLTASVSGINETHSGACDGSLTVTSNGANLAYTWSNNSFAHTSHITGVCHGTYSVTITDPNGCQKTTQGFVGTDTTSGPCAGFSASISATNESHQGACDGSLTLTSNRSLTSVMWSDSAFTGTTVTGVCYGYYSVTVHDSLGCQVYTSAVVDSTTTNACTGFTASITPTNETVTGACNGTLSVTANHYAVSYVWSDSTFHNAQVSGVCSGSYSVVVTDTMGCVKTVSATIAADSASNPCSNFTASITTTNETSAGACDGSLTVTSSGNQVTYTWSDSTFTGAAVTGVCHGVYSVVVMDPNGCQATASASVTTDSTFNPCAAFEVNISSTMNQTFSGACNGTASAAVSNGVAPYAYNWGGLSSTTPQFSGLCAGMFNVTVTDANGCSASATGSVGTDSVVGPCNGVTINITLTSTVATAGNCDGVITSNVSGGIAPYHFSWSNGYHTSHLTNACMGYYNVQLMDANGCLGTSSVFVHGDTSVAVPLTISIITNDVDSAGACNGSAHVNAAGGVGPYSITYSNNTSGGQVNNLCAGFYTAFVTDANGLQDSIFFVIGSPENTYTNTQTDPLNDSVVVATLTNDAVNSCSIDFANIDSIGVTNYYLGNNDSIVVLWTIYSVVAGDTMLNQMYGPGPFGVYEVVLSIYCESRAIGDFAKAYGKILVNSQLTGIQTVDKAVATVVYPNPFSNSFNINLTAAATVSVTDITGKLMLSTRANSGTLQIPATNLAKGIYFVIITTNKGREVAKLVKE